jgi:hypothetical protein
MNTYLCVDIAFRHFFVTTMDFKVNAFTKPGNAHNDEQLRK